MKNKYAYPFSAIVGQTLLKKALIINIVNPTVGGLLISGEKGTGKSTLVRGLGNLIHDMEVIELPLNITEDSLVGSIDIEKTVSDGKPVANRSVLMRANGNILYVDEVNLLNESIVNALLEVSQSGINSVEREGISLVHESNFILIGTMNPEEGGLRPQFLDRFGLYVEVTAENDVKDRKNIIKRRIEYEEDPTLFIKDWVIEDNNIWNKIEKARKALGTVKVSEDMMKLASEISMKANCSGHRAEIIMIEASKAIAVLNGRKNIIIEDLKEASELVIPHRMRDVPQDISVTEEDNDGKSKDDSDEERTGEQKHRDDSDKYDSLEEFEDSTQTDDIEDYPNSYAENIDDIGNSFKIKDLNIKSLDRRTRKGSGRRSIVRTSELQGRYVRYTIPKGKLKDIAFDATLRAAAPYQSIRDKKGLALSIKECDIREKIRERRTGSTILFVVDASGSMGANKRMEAVKGAIMSLLNDAYQKRDMVGMVAFRKDKAESVLSITRSVDLAYKMLKDLPTGGKTPLTQGLKRGYDILKASKKKDKNIIPVMVLVSDGKGNVSLSGEDPLKEALSVSNEIALEGIQCIVIDTEQEYVKLNLAKDIAKAMNASYYRLEDLKADEILSVVKNNI